jgi:hypothetical protein
MIHRLENNPIRHPDRARDPAAEQIESLDDDEQVQSRGAGFGQTRSPIGKLKDGSLAHLPSGSYVANAAWVACAVTAFNLARAAAIAAGLPRPAGRACVPRSSTSQPGLRAPDDASCSTYPSTGPGLLAGLLCTPPRPAHRQPRGPDHPAARRDQGPAVEMLGRPADSPRLDTRLTTRTPEPQSENQRQWIRAERRGRAQLPL